MRTADTAGSTPHREYWQWLVLALLGWMTFPGQYPFARPGLDPSWKTGLNLFSQPGFVFGRDVIFTYGPLGYLDHPLEIGSNLAQAAWLRVLVQLGMLATVARVFRHRPAVWLWPFCLGWILLVLSQREFDYELLGWMFLLLALALEDGVRWSLVLAAPFPALLLFVKFGSGLCALALLLWGVVLFGLRRRDWRAPALAVAVFALALGALLARLFGSFRSAREFLGRSLQVASGYNASMSILGDDAPIYAALAFVAVLALVALLPRARDPGFTWIVVLGAVPMAYALKHGFVRQDGAHESIPFTVLAWTALVALLFARRAAARVTSLLLIIGCAIAHGSVLGPAERRARHPAIASLLTFRTGSANVARFVGLQRTRESLGIAPSRLLDSDRLPADWLATIGSSTVLVVPWEISICWANALECVPYPTLQMYSTYTAELDRWTARRLLEAKPAFVVAAVDSIDGRNMVWDCPETWLALLQGYEVLQVDDDHGRLLLRRRDTPQEWKQLSTGKLLGRVGEWVEFPPRSMPLRVALTFETPLAATLRTMLLRPIPLELEVRGEHGEVRSHRLVVDTARSGLLVDAAPRTASGLADLFDCCKVPSRVTAIRVAPSASRMVLPEYAVTWTTVQTPRGLGVDSPASRGSGELAPEKAFGHIDALNRQAADSSPGPIVIELSDQVLTVVGWAADPDRRVAPAAVFLEFDRELRIPTESGFSREDVAAAFNEPRYARTGFRGGVSLDQLGTGTHVLRLQVVSADGRRVWATDPVALVVR